MPDDPLTVNARSDTNGQGLCVLYADPVDGYPRGKICDRDPIARALKNGQLAGYAGDVWSPQPARRITRGGPCRTTA
jgi:hypothetical protein